MKHTNRFMTGALALMLVLGGVSCGRTANTSVTEPSAVTADPTQSTALDTAVEESPGGTWLVPSEEECPAASRDDAPLIMTVEDVTPTQATLVLRAKDGSEFGVGYGPRYGIERFEENGWVGVGLGRKFPEPSYKTSARAEHRDTVTFMADGAPLAPGYYRLCKNFSTTTNGKFVEITYYAYFEIGE